MYLIYYQLSQYTQLGDEDKLELIKQISPVAWINVNLNGTYTFSFDDKMINIDDLLKPLI